MLYAQNDFLSKMFSYQFIEEPKLCFKISNYLIFKFLRLILDTSCKTGSSFPGIRRDLSSWYIFMSLNFFSVGWSIDIHCRLSIMIFSLNTRHLAMISPVKQYLMTLPCGTHICNYSKIFELCSTTSKNRTSTKTICWPCCWRF